MEMTLADSRSTTRSLSNGIMRKEKKSCQVLRITYARYEKHKESSDKQLEREIYGRPYYRQKH